MLINETAYQIAFDKETDPFVKRLFRGVIEAYEDAKAEQPCLSSIEDKKSCLSKTGQNEEQARQPDTISSVDATKPITMRSGYASEANTQQLAEIPYHASVGLDSFVTRLEKSLQTTLAVKSGTATVSCRDLRDVLYHFVRMDNEARQRHHERESIKHWELGEFLENAEGAPEYPSVLANQLLAQFDIRRRG